MHTLVSMTLLFSSAYDTNHPIPREGNRDKDQHSVQVRGLRVLPTRSFPRLVRMPSRNVESRSTKVIHWVTYPHYIALEAHVIDERKRATVFQVCLQLAF